MPKPITNTITNKIDMYFDDGVDNVDVDKFCKKICESNRNRYNCKNTEDNTGCIGNAWNTPIVDNFQRCQSYKTGKRIYYGEKGVQIECSVEQVGKKRRE